MQLVYVYVLIEWQLDINNCSFLIYVNHSEILHSNSTVFVRSTETQLIHCGMVQITVNCQ